MIRIESGLPDAELATLIASSGFVTAVTPELRRDVDSHLKGGEIVYRIFDGDIEGGFSIFKIFDRALYLSGIILAPALQGRGVAAQVVRVAAQKTETEFLLLRTQSLRMWIAGSRMSRTWYPYPLVEPPSLEREVGERVAYEIGCEFPFSSGFYGSPLYGEKPIYREPHLQEWWDSVCNFERGDAVLCIGRI